MPSLCVFSKQDNALVGWPDAISAYMMPGIAMLLLMLKQGIHPKVVQERLGHASIQVTLDTYSHVAPGLQAAAAKRFDEAFSNAYNKTETEVVEKHY